jgi:hypothetical protein
MQEEQKPIVGTAKAAEAAVAQTRSPVELFERLEKSAQAQVRYKSLIAQGNEPEKFNIFEAIEAQRQIEANRVENEEANPPSAGEKND